MGRTILKQSLAQLREVQEEEAEEAMAAVDDGEFPPLERPAHTEKQRYGKATSRSKLSFTIQVIFFTQYIETTHELNNYIYV